MAPRVVAEKQTFPAPTARLSFGESGLLPKYLRMSQRHPQSRHTPHGGSDFFCTLGTNLEVVELEASASCQNNLRVVGSFSINHFRKK